MKPGLLELMSQRILILDGAMGTMFQWVEKSDVPYDVWNLSRPEVVEDIHRKYLEAGADVIETNTFNAQRMSLSVYGQEKYVADLNFKEALSCRRLAEEFTFKTPDKPRFVVGAIGPTACICLPRAEGKDLKYPECRFQQFVEGYQEQMTALIRGGVDALLIETIYQLENAKAAVCAAVQTMQQMNREVPIMLSFTAPRQMNASVFAEQVVSFLQGLPSFPLLSVGMNCSYGAKQMRPFVRELSRRLPYFISAYPSAGFPDRLGLYTQTTDNFLTEMKKYVDEGLVNLIGGCCGTTDEIIAGLTTLVCSEGMWIPPHQPVVLE